MSEIVLVTVSGADRPGLTSAFTILLADAGATLLDIGQAVVHSSLTFGLMVRVDADRIAGITDAAQTLAERAGVNVNVTVVTPEMYGRWIDQQKHQRFIVTLLGAHITAAQLAAVTHRFVDHGLNIDLMERLSGRDVASRSTYPRMCIEFTLSGSAGNAADLRKSLLSLADEDDFDIAVQEDSLFRRNRRLVVFDMDSTLIQMEVIDELARRAGVYDAVSEITASAMRGEIDFPTSFRQRMALLKGLSTEALDDVDLPLTPGTRRLMRTLKMLGYKTGIISGGFTHFARRLQVDLGFDYVYAHELAVEDGRLTGDVVGGIIDGPRKAEILREIAGRENIALAQTIAVGDGANDLPMLSIAGIGVAFHAKPLVRAKAQHSISSMGLDALLYLLGIRDRHVGN